MFQNSIKCVNEVFNNFEKEKLQNIIKYFYFVINHG